MNNVVLSGRIANDVKLRQTNTGKQFCNICIAITKDHKNEKGQYDADFVDIVLWGSTAKNTAEYKMKGDMIGINGKIQTRFIEDADGGRKKKTEIIADKVIFFPSKDNPNKKKDDMER